MLPRELIGVANVPGGDRLRLIRHGSDHIIMLEGNELMSSRMSGSEIALATITCERLGKTHAPHILIGGYGMGFTLRAALAALDGAARVTVAELIPEIIEWARGPMQELTAGGLDDPRVDVFLGDVATPIRDKHNTFDAILLDVDNGPDGLTRASNNWLYSAKGLKAAQKSLKPGGILAVWSAGHDAGFTRRLQATGFQTEEKSVPSRSNGKGRRHVIWFAIKR